MPVTLARLADLAALGFDDVIDVRAPAEYAEDHLPGAISLPVLSDEERARVGTIYKQVSPFSARKIGAALVARNAATHIEGPLADRDGGWRPLVYCWRGGQRSGSFATILRQIGWRAETIEGGYKSWRRLVVAALYDDAFPCPMVVIDGGTGTGKTRILAHLESIGAQVIDLEALARHRGSVFGPVGDDQPSQKTFDSALAGRMSGLDPARPVFVEAESARIGRINLPAGVVQAMRAAPVVRITAPVTARVKHLLGAYDDLTADPERLDRVLTRLVPYHGHAQVDAWRALAAGGDFAQLAAELIDVHYDPKYIRLSRPGDRDEIALPDLDDPTLAALARDLAARYG